MNTANSSPFSAAAAEFAVPQVAPDFDIDAFRESYLERAKRRDAEKQFELDCPVGLRNSDWNHPGIATNRSVIERVMQWQPGPKGLLLSGPTGRGKTRATFALYRRLLVDELRDARFYFAGDFFNKLQGEVQYGRDDAAGWISATAARPILILDDLGQQAMLTARADWAEAWFFSLLDRRLSNRLPLIVSTNLPATEIAGSTSGAAVRQEPLLRRLLELCEVVKFV